MHAALPSCLVAAPVAFRRSPQGHLVNLGISLTRAGLRYAISSFDPCLYSVFQGDGGAVGAFAAHLDGNLSSGRQDVLSITQALSEAHFG